MMENVEVLKQLIEKSKSKKKTKILLGGGIGFENVK